MKLTVVLATAVVLFAGCGETQRASPIPGTPALPPDAGVKAEPKKEEAHATVVLMTRSELFKMAHDLLTRLEKFTQVDEIVNLRTGVIFKASDSQVEEHQEIHWVNDHVFVVVSPGQELL